MKNSEERELKIKEKKINKKLNSLEERETQLIKKNPNHIIPNNNEVPKSLIYSCSPIPLSPSTNYSNCVQSVTASVNMNSISFHPSTVSYWLPPPCELTSNGFYSSLSHRVSFLSDKPIQTSTTSGLAMQASFTVTDTAMAKEGFKLIESMLETLDKKLDKWNKTDLDILRKSAS